MQKDNMYAEVGPRVTPVKHREFIAAPQNIVLFAKWK